MVDTPTSRNRFRKQELGTNTNTWGDTKLNEVLDCIDQALDGVEAIDLGAATSYTLVTTNYTTADQAKQRVLKFSNANAAGSAVIIPSVEHEYNCVNAAGFAVTVKTSTGSGVAIPNGYQARVYCDAVNVYNGSPTLLGGSVQVAGQVKNVTAASDNLDAVNLAQMAAAIAASVPAGTAGTVLNSVTDTTRGFLSAKVTLSLSGLTTTQVAGLSSLQLSTKNPGGNERLKISSGQGYVGGFLNGGTKTAQYTPALGTEYNADHTTASFTHNLAGITSPQIGQKFKINCFGNFPPFLLGTVNGIVNLYLDPGFEGELTYSGSAWGWN